MMNILEQFTNPDTIQSMTMSDKLVGITITTILGMSITFIALIVLWMVIASMSKAVNKTNGKEAVNVVTETTAASATIVEASSVEQSDEDEELIAVISAAVAASMNTSIHNIVVKNIVRVPDHAPSWHRAGRVEQMNSRF